MSDAGLDTSGSGAAGSDAGAATAGAGGTSDAGGATAGAGGTSDAGSATAGAAGTSDAGAATAGAAGTSDAGAATAGTGGAHDAAAAETGDASTATAGTGGAHDASADAPADGSTGGGNASCVTLIAAGGGYRETEILARRADGTVAYYDQNDRLVGNTVIPDTSAHFREVIRADQTPFKASDVVVGPLGPGGASNVNAIGCGIVQGNVWCFPFGTTRDAFYLGAGFGHSDVESWPVAVVTSVGGPSLTDVQQLAAAKSPTFCAVKSNGSIWCWGSGYFGQLGQGDAATAPFGSYGNDSSFARPVLADANTPFSNAAEVRLGAQTACARKEDGTVWCWGLNQWGEIPSAPPSRAVFPTQITFPGTGTQTISTRLMSTADRTWCSIMKDMTVVCWGENHDGQSGVPFGATLSNEEIAPPTQVLASMGGVAAFASVIDLTYTSVLGAATCARTSSLDVFCWGNDWPYPKPYLDSTKAAVSAVNVPLAGTDNGLVYVDASGFLRSNGKMLQSQPCPPAH